MNKSDSGSDSRYEVASNSSIEFESGSDSGLPSVPSLGAPIRLKELQDLFKDVSDSFRTQYRKKTGQEYYFEKLLIKQNELIEQLSNSDISKKEAIRNTSSVLVESIKQVRDDSLPHTLFENYENKEIKKNIFKTIKSGNKNELVRLLISKFSEIEKQVKANLGSSNNELKSCIKKFISDTVNNAKKCTIIISEIKEPSINNVVGDAKTHVKFSNTSPNKNSWVVSYNNERNSTTNNQRNSATELSC